MHTVAERTPREQLPDVIVDLLDRNAHRRSNRLSAWRQHQSAARAWRDGYERVADRAAGAGLDGEGVEL
jgi:hypothetical protein